jgi:hypothetical protein
VVAVEKKIERVNKGSCLLRGEERRETVTSVITCRRERVREKRERHGKQCKTKAASRRSRSSSRK